MKIYTRLWKHLAEFFLECEAFQTKAVIKIKIHISSTKILFSRKAYRLWANVKKCARPGQATDDNIINRMRFAYEIT
jgi:hypothetical protein